MRRVISIILILVTVFSVTACKKGGNGNGSGNGDNNDTVQQVTVTFNLNGGTGSAPAKTVDKGTTVAEPSAPSHSTKLFEGWYTELTGGRKWVFETDKVEADITLFARYKEKNSEYENTMTWSQSGFLYFHYYRFKNTEEDYALWEVWAWPLNGNGKAFNWETYDDSGAVLGVDLNATYQDDEYGKDFVYSDKEDLGFLIVLKSSKGKDGHWASDGSANTFIRGYADHVRADGSIHVFITQNNVRNFSYSFTNTSEITDPYEGINPQDHISVTNVNSSNFAYNMEATSQDFLNNVGVGYTIFVASFADSNGDGIGDLRGIINSLDYLAGTLNAKVLWLTPIQLSESYHGYDIIDYYKIDPKFGTMADYRELLYEAHKRDIRILMDLVPNHSSANNVWFIKSSQLDPEYRSFYRWAYGEEYKDKDFWYPYSDTGFYFYGKFASSMPEFNFDYQGTRDAFVDMAKYWLSFGLDGFRLDAVKHIYNEGEYDPATKGVNDVVIKDEKIISETEKIDYSYNTTKNVAFLREFSARVKATYPDSFMVGEFFSGDPAKVVDYYGGVESLFNFKTYYAFCESTLTYGNNGGAKGIAGVMEEFYNSYKNVRSNFIDSSFTSNHDVERLLNFTEGGGAISYGNRATTVKKAELVAATILTLPGISWIYYGDELGMSGYEHPNLYPDGSFKDDHHMDRHWRQPFKWDTNGTDSRTTGYDFEVYTVEWDDYNVMLAGVAEQLQDNSSTLKHYSRLTALKNDPVMIRGSLVRNESTPQYIMSYKRSYGGKTYVVYHNYASFDVDTYFGGTVLFASQGATGSKMPAYSTLIVQE